MRHVYSSTAEATQGFLFVEDPPISSRGISSSPIWVENYGNREPTSSFETIVGLFAGTEENICKLWELTVEEVWVFDIK